MKNFVKEADIVTLTPTVAVASGGAYMAGSIFGVALNDIAANAPGEFVREGEVYLPKDTTAVTQGLKIYWDATNKVVTATASLGTAVGAATAAAGTAAAGVNVLLDGQIR